jgi:hypothetical protein
MLIYLNACVACPDYVLPAGKVFDVSPKLAAKLMSTEAGGIPVYTGEGGAMRFKPAAERYDERKHGKRPVLRVNVRPDPGDIECEQVEPEIEYLSTEDD